MHSSNFNLKPASKRPARGPSLPLPPHLPFTPRLRALARNPEWPFFCFSLLFLALNLALSISYCMIQGKASFSAERCTAQWDCTHPPFSPKTSLMSSLDPSSGDGCDVPFEGCISYLALMKRKSKKEFAVALTKIFTIYY